MITSDLPNALMLDLAKALIRVESKEQFWALPREDRLWRLTMMQRIEACERKLHLRVVEEWHSQRDAQRAAYLASLPEQVVRREAAQKAIQSLKGLLIARDGYICGICGDLVPPDQVSIDHIVPISKGGGDAIENLQVAHRACNSRKGNRMPEGLT